MKEKPNFNLVNDPWIPVVGSGLVSLRDVFGCKTIGRLAGLPIQKIMMLRFLLAIAQRALTPKDRDDWVTLRPEGVAEVSLAYLERFHESFWLYGERPFLQMTAIGQAEKVPYGALLPHVATGNTTLLQDLNRELPLSDAEKALLVVVLSGFGFGGKKADNGIVLTPGYTGKKNEKGKPSTGRPGACLGYLGYQHHYILGESLLETIWFNMLTAEDLDGLKVFSEGVGVPPWEAMPQGEDCPVAKALKNSLMGRLVPLSKFFLLAEDAVHYSDGIEHPDYKSGGFDTFIAIDTSGKKPKALWADPDKQFWRDLSALLAFLANKQGMSCFSLKTNIKRVREQCDHFELWAGGLRVSSNAGEQYATGGDDFVESVLWLSSKDVGRDWFIALQGEIDELDKLSRVLYAAVRGYGRYQKNQDDAQAKKATAMYWQRCNSKAQDLVGTCYSSTTTKVLRREFASFVREAYDSVCPRSTARQWEAWAANTPNLASYLKH